MTVGILESESTGGAVARVGFGYQDAFVLQRIPRWLSQGAFSHVVSEAVGDVEVCYFDHSGSVIHVLHEAKDYALTATQFWDELARFQTIHTASPSEFPRFVLVCRDFKPVVMPLVSKIQRIRGVGSAFSSDSEVLLSDREQVVQWVLKAGHSRELAEFVLAHVDFEAYAAEHAEEAFAGEVAKWLPSLDLSSKRVSALRDRCKELVSRSSLGPLNRRTLETALEDALGSAASEWVVTPTRLFTGETAIPDGELGLILGPFNGGDRASRTQVEWDRLTASATLVSRFLKSSRGRKAVAIDGKQRMSVACVLGHAFSATQGHVLQIDHNGVLYRTDDHTRAAGVFFKLDRQPSALPEKKEGVVCIGFPTAIGSDWAVGSSAPLQGLPLLTLSGGNPIDGMKALNIAVAEAKEAMVEFRSSCGLDLIHLFIKAPSVFSMALGHRLNGIGKVQLYDWVDGHYLPTALVTPS